MDEAIFEEAFLETVDGAISAFLKEHIVPGTMLSVKQELVLLMAQSAIKVAERYLLTYVVCPENLESAAQRDSIEIAFYAGKDNAMVKVYSLSELVSRLEQIYLGKLTWPPEILNAEDVFPVI
jgi:hypothetical protein